VYGVYGVHDKKTKNLCAGVPSIIETITSTPWGSGHGSHVNWWMGSKRGKWQAQVSECIDLG
jgi:hypothetical protein